MNKIITVALIAGGLLLLDAPEAAAHNDIRISYQPSAYYQIDVRRTHRMPYWLKRNKEFRHWYRHTRLRRQRHLTWHRLFDIYRWETVDRRKHRRAHRIARNHDYYRYHWRDGRRGHRH
ncbi:MAG: hypothetical protein ACR2RD_19050 [Woeseiaceae bacterium]